MTTEKFALILVIKQNFAYLCTRKQKRRGVAQLVARYVRDVEVGSSSLLTPTIIIMACSPLKTASLSIFLFLKQSHRQYLFIPISEQIFIAHLITHVV